MYKKIEHVFLYWNTKDATLNRGMSPIEEAVDISHYLITSINLIVHCSKAKKTDMFSHKKYEQNERFRKVKKILISSIFFNFLLFSLLINEKYFEEIFWTETNWVLNIAIKIFSVAKNFCPKFELGINSVNVNISKTMRVIENIHKEHIAMKWVPIIGIEIFREFKVCQVWT